MSGGELRVQTRAASRQRGRQAAAQLLQQLVVREHFLVPGGLVDARDLLVPLARELLQAAPIEVLEPRHDAERGVDAAGAALAAPDDPLQHAHVLAKAGPDELAIC